MKYVINFLAVFVLLFVVVFIITSIFVGIGGIVSYLFDLTLFHSTLLCLGSAFVLSFFIFATTESRFRKKQVSEDELDELEDIFFSNDKFSYKIKPVTVISDLSKKTKPKKK